MSTRNRWFVFCSALALWASCSGGESDSVPDASTDDPPLFEGEFAENFDSFVVDDSSIGPAFVTVADVVAGNDALEIVVSFFGSSEWTGSLDGLLEGSAMMYTWTGPSLDDWSAIEILPTQEGLRVPNAISAADIDGDGDMDLFVPSGFIMCVGIPGMGDCGALSWLEQTDGGWNRHVIVEYGSELFYHHVELFDFDGDGLDDILTVGEHYLGGDGDAVVQVFYGTEGEDRFEPVAHDLVEGLGAIPRLWDLDADGDLDAFSAEYFHNDSVGVSFAWAEQIGGPTSENPAGDWVRHVIADDLGPSIQFSFVPDLFSDGQLRAVGANHTNTTSDPQAPESQVVVFDPIPEDPTETPWPFTKISEGIVSRENPDLGKHGAPGVFAHGDVNGDGLIDIVVSGDGDERVFVLLQVSTGEFETYVLAEEMGQAGVGEVADIDGDGVNEIVVSSYEQNRVVIYKWKG